MTFLINSPVANLYANPSDQSEVISQVLYGQNVCIVEEEKNFKKIETEDPYQGWISNSDLFCEKFKNSTLFKRYVKTIHNANHLYLEPDLTKQKPLLTLPFEIKLEVVNEPDFEHYRWIQVCLVNKQLAWIQRANVTFDFNQLTFPQVLELSQQFLGLPYTWGGVSSFGYDCSGFIQMLFRQMHVSLPRDAYQQINDANFYTIDETCLCAGDVVFFNSFSQRVTHVGLCLSPTILIHATSREIPTLQLTHLNDLALAKRYAARFYKRLRANLD